MKKYISFFESHEVYESIKWQYVIRDGKRVKKPISNNPDMRIEYKNDKPHEVRKTGSEKKQMSIQNKKSARKAKSKKTATVRKQQRSLKKHTWDN